MLSPGKLLKIVSASEDKKIKNTIPNSFPVLALSFGKTASRSCLNLAGGCPPDWQRQDNRQGHQSTIQLRYLLAHTKKNADRCS